MGKIIEIFVNIVGYMMESLSLLAPPAILSYIATLGIFKILKHTVKNIKLLRILAIIIFFILYVAFITIWFNSPCSPKLYSPK